MRGPLIGITAVPPRGLHRYLLTRLALRRAGARATLLSPDSALPGEPLEGLILGGGDDIGAELYTGHPDPKLDTDPAFDRFELALLDDALRRGIPVLGICRGMQMMNVALGGTLYREVSQRFPRARRTHTILPLKTIRLRTDSRLYGILGKRFCRINGLHHQAVQQLGSDMTVVATDRAGIVEAIEGRTRDFFIGVQWHPELLPYMSRHQRLFRALVDAARAFGRTGTGASAAPGQPLHEVRHGPGRAG